MFSQFLSLQKNLKSKRRNQFCWEVIKTDFSFPINKIDPKSKLQHRARTTEERERDRDATRESVLSFSPPRCPILLSLSSSQPISPSGFYHLRHSYSPSNNRSVQSTYYPYCPDKSHGPSSTTSAAVQSTFCPLLWAMFLPRTTPWSGKELAFKTTRLGWSFTTKVAANLVGALFTSRFVWILGCFCLVTLC